MAIRNIKSNKLTIIQRVEASVCRWIARRIETHYLIKEKLHSKLN